MKKNLTDRIEQYLKVLIERSEDKQIEIQRTELAETFCCVPSQVTYVLNTRFTEQEGYCTVSRRGGGGFVRISQYRLESWDAQRQNPLFKYIDDLKEQGKLSERESALVSYLALHSGDNLPLEYRLRFNEGLYKSLRSLFE
ncbi:MAG: CtsR family transcriptional regulator [Syntrophomonadaceae bacterium]|nr:CtsR family transcriptional regulator [Syntrophomonadaceae bacterium]